MSVILKEIEKREKILAEYDGKVARLEEITAEKETLEKEIAEYTPETLKAEIDELKDYGVQLGLIEKPADESKEETPCDNVVEGQPAVATSF